MAESFGKSGERKFIELPKERNASLVERAYEKALDVFKNDEIDPNDFVSYNQKIVREDLEYVEATEAAIKATEANRADPDGQQKNKKLALILEAIILEQTELSDWLGPDVFTRKASRWDDLKNGVDMLAVFKQEDGRKLVLAIDATLRDPAKKLRKIKKEIENGRLTKVKYFDSGDGEYHGKLLQVPRVVVGVSGGTAVKLAELWLKGKKSELADDPIQLQILDEISMQLREFMKYADGQGQTDAAEIYARMFMTVETIRQKKTKLSDQPDAGKYKLADVAYKGLLYRLEEVFQKSIIDKDEDGVA